MDDKTVEKVIDTVVYPIPPRESELDAKSLGPKRLGLKPFKISQPEGASFKIKGNQITWDNWRFRYVMHPREGLVIYLVEYKARRMASDERPSHWL